MFAHDEEAARAKNPTNKGEVFEEFGRMKVVEAHHDRHKVDTLGGDVGLPRIHDHVEGVVTPRVFASNKVNWI
jgi:hypothetical protein